MNNKLGFILTVCVMAAAGCDLADHELEQSQSALTRSFVATRDTRLEQKAPSRNYATHTLLWATGASENVSGVLAEAALAFDVSSIPAGATATGARLKIYVSDGTVSRYDVFTLQRAWTETGATWLDRAAGASWQAPGANGTGDRGSAAVGSFTGAAASAWKTIELDVDTVQGWIDSPASNHGLLLRPPLANPQHSTDHLAFHSREHANKPTLEIDYTTQALAHWSLDQTSGNTAIDASGHGHGATLVNGPVWAPGRVGGGLVFDGIDDEVVRVDPGAALKPTARFAVAAWVKTTATGVAGGEVVSMGDSYVLRVQPDGNVRAIFYDGAAWQSHITSNVNVKDGSWHHLVGQYDGNAIQVFVDGVARGQTSATGAIAYTKGPSLHLGRHGNGKTDRYFRGTLDEVRVYGRALTPAEIAALAAEGGSSGDAPRLKVITWNLWKHREGTAPQAAHLAAQDPDVIITQETYAANATTIKNALGAGWNHVHYASGTAEGVAVFYRLPLVGSPETRVIGDSSWGGKRVAIRVRLDVQGRAVDVFATHLDWPKSGTWLETGEHALGRNALLSWIDSVSGPKIFGGDLNAHTAGSTVQQTTIAQSDLRGTDSCRIHGSHAYCNSNFATKNTRLDYLFRSSELKTISHDVLPHGGLSDHRMVSAVFELP
jgi:endonuclease/exonuclease/phosphatase (EEP) superfamily protein YafD